MDKIPQYKQSCTKHLWNRWVERHFSATDRMSFSRCVFPNISIFVLCLSQHLGNFASASIHDFQRPRYQLRCFVMSKQTEPFLFFSFHYQMQIFPYSDISFLILEVYIGMRYSLIFRKRFSLHRKSVFSQIHGIRWRTWYSKAINFDKDLIKIFSYNLYPSKLYRTYKQISSYGWHWNILSLFLFFTKGFFSRFYLVFVEGKHIYCIVRWNILVFQPTPCQKLIIYSS